MAGQKRVGNPAGARTAPPTLTLCKRQTANNHPTHSTPHAMGDLIWNLMLESGCAVACRDKDRRSDELNPSRRRPAKEGGRSAQAQLQGRAASGRGMGE
jgi:hypothetical protein